MYYMRGSRHITLEKRGVGQGHSGNRIRFGLEPLLGDKIFEHECAIVLNFIRNISIPIFSAKTPL